MIQLILRAAALCTTFALAFVASITLSTSQPEVQEAHSATTKRTHVSFPRMDLASLSQSSAQVIVGEVMTVEEVRIVQPWLPGQTDALPYQRYSIGVHTALLGETEGVLPLYVPGGSDWTVVDAPTLHAGQRYVLFLTQGESEDWFVTGLQQGVLPIETGQTSDESWVTFEEQRRPLTEFLGEIHATVAETQDNTSSPSQPQD